MAAERRAEAPGTGMSGAPAHPRRSWVVRGVALVAVLLTGWHLFASFLWISPPSELRALVPGDLLSSYMLPWYGQSWSVFAPEPINGDYRLRVRAVVDRGTDASGAPVLEVTDWVDATAIELSMSRYSLFPPRAAGLATQQASALLNAWTELTDEQQQAVTLASDPGDDWPDRMRDELIALGGGASVDDYIAQERSTAAYATQVALAVWGDSAVSQVQFEVSRQNVVPFEQRNDPDAERPDPQIASTGWRAPIVLPGQSTAPFREVFFDAARREAAA